MQIKIPRGMKSKIKEERDKTFLEMSKETIREEEITKIISTLDWESEDEKDLNKIDHYEELRRESLKNWDNLNKKYQAYNDMLKPSWKINPDTLLIVGGNLAGILLILNFEKMDIVRSKAMSFVLKGRV